MNADPNALNALRDQLNKHRKDISYSIIIGNIEMAMWKLQELKMVDEIFSKQAIPREFDDSYRTIIKVTIKKLVNECL